MKKKYQNLLKQEINIDLIEEDKINSLFTRQKKFLIIDCNSVIYQLFFITSKQRDKVMRVNDNLWTNAVYGFINFLRTIIRKEQFDYICCAFDASRKSFRTDFYKDYKMQRPKTPFEVIYQIQIIKDFLKIVKIPFFSILNYEADDIIGSIVEKFKDKCQIYIYSSDHDLYQLIDDKFDVICCNTQKGMINPQKITKSNFNNIVKIPLKFFLDYKILKGDTSDNLSGIRGWGPKTILNYLTKFNGLSNLLNNIEKILNPKLKEALKCSKKKIELYKKLMPIYKNIGFPISDKLDDYKITLYYQSLNSDELINFYQKYKFKSFLKNN